MTDIKHFGIICNLNYWTCSSCGVDVVIEGRRACECITRRGCNSEYRMNLGWVEEHKALVRTMVREGNTFSPETVLWANTFTINGYRVELDKNGGHVHAPGGMCGWTDITSSTFQAGDRDGEFRSTVVRLVNEALALAADSYELCAEDDVRPWMINIKTVREAWSLYDGLDGPGRKLKVLRSSDGKEMTRVSYVGVEPETSTETA